MADDTPGLGGNAPSPPYIPWKTFLNLLTKMQEGVPGRLDGSWLSSLAGGMHQPIMATFRFFGLTDANNVPLPLLHQIAADVDNRQDRMRDLLMASYSWATELGPNATHGQLEEAFRKQGGLSGSTMRKAIRFFLSGAKYAGLELSPHYRSVRDSQGNGRTTGPARRRSSTTKRRQPPLGDAPPSPPTPHSLHEIEPAVLAWLQRIPRKGEAWPKRNSWFKTLKAITDGIYEADDEGGDDE